MRFGFEKWQALGNDYVILEQEQLPFELTPVRIERICDPHLGCGSDGVLLLSRTDGQRFEARMRVFNADGSEAELSGNGARQAILYLYRKGWTDKTEFSIETAAGEIKPTIIDERTCAVQMGKAKLRSADFPSGGPDGRGTLTAAGQTFEFQHMSIGNPQCVIEVGEELERLDLERLGPPIEQSELFPNRTNVAFIRVEPNGTVSARIFERGVGVTLSSGTGACAAAVTALLRGVSSPLRVRLAGGELLVAVDAGLNVTLTGWAEPVFEGSFSEDFLSALEGLA